jgi:hypothetical protein
VGGCWNCGAAVAAVGSLALGATVASASQPSTTVVVNAAPAVAVGARVGSLPGGCEKVKVSGTLFYQCGSAWYKPGFGDSGFYYQIVPVP